MVIRNETTKANVSDASTAECAQSLHSSVHTHAEFHHGHSHAEESHHAGGHHLLQVENLSIGFTMYIELDEAEDDEADIEEDLGQGCEEGGEKQSRKGFGRVGLARHPKHVRRSRSRHLRHSNHLSSEQRMSKVIDRLSLSVHAGEILAVVGASGSGKTLLADAIMGLYTSNAQVSGIIYYDGVQQDAQSLAALRGREIAFVPQSVKSLDPLMKVGKQIGGSSQRRAELFERYGLSPDVEDLYPFELSGGMARRVLLCTVLMGDPRLIIADEPTPGLDLELAVKAMDDFRSFANEGKGVLLITHDIELALRVADRVAVFKDGTVVEETAVANFASPDLLQHPFSRALWYALPEHEFVAKCEEDLAGNVYISQDASGEALLEAEDMSGGETAHS